MKKIRKAVIPVAGIGTRFLPVTKSIPKEMLPIVDKPILHYIIEECVESGIEEILLINSPYKKCIKEYFDRNYELEDILKNRGKIKESKMIEEISKLATFFYITQNEPLGSGHAIGLAKDFVGNEPFAVLYGDDIIYSSDRPALKQLVEKYEINNSSIIGCLEVPKNVVNRYGIIKFKEGQNKIDTIIEKPSLDEAPSTVAGLGRYILNPEIFEYIENLNANKNGEYQFTDAMKEMMKDYNYEVCMIEGTYYDTGSKEGYLKANIDFSLKRDDLKDKVINILKETNLK